MGCDVVLTVLKGRVAPPGDRAAAEGGAVSRASGEPRLRTVMSEAAVNPNPRRRPVEQVDDKRHNPRDNRAEPRERLREAAVELVDAIADLLTARGVDSAVHEGLLTVTHVAAQLHRSLSTVRAWCAAGRFITAFKLSGRDWRVPVEALAQFIAAQQPEPSSQHVPRRTITARPNNQPRPRRAQAGERPDLSAWRRVRPKGAA